MQSVVEVVCLGGGKTYNSIYTDPGYCKMVIVQDDERFPAPRLCLLRKWPNFEGGFGFHLFEDLLNSTGALKIESVLKGSPAEAGGLRANDVIIEINGDNIEYKSFFRLIEVLKEAFNQQEMELLVLGEADADWYRVRNITVNSNFPNIEYCETPYYGYKFRTLDSTSPLSSASNRLSKSQQQQQQQQQQSAQKQFEIHSNSGKVFRTTLVIDKDKESLYRRIEELPKDNRDNVPLRVYYRKAACEDTTFTDSGHGTLRKGVSLSQATQSAPLSPFSTIGKSCGENVQVDLLHDRWGDLMDRYLDNKYRSNSMPNGAQNQDSSMRDTLASTSTKNIIYLNDETLKRARSRTQSPLARDQQQQQQQQSEQSASSFSFLFSGRDDYSTSTATTSANRFKSPTKQQSKISSSVNREERESSPCKNASVAPHSIIVRPKINSQSLGFELDEAKLEENGLYVVKSVDTSSPSAVAGLKEGDKITKINGKSTQCMSYDEFCDEIEIAQQMHKKHNMIHLMVMRKSAKKQQAATTITTTTTTTTDITSPSTTDTTTTSNDSKPSLSSSSLVSDNLISIIKVTSQKDLSDQSATLKPIIQSASASTITTKPNVIYTHEPEKDTPQVAPKEVSFKDKSKPVEKTQVNNETLSVLTKLGILAEKEASKRETVDAIKPVIIKKEEPIQATIVTEKYHKQVDEILVESFRDETEIVNTSTHSSDYDNTQSLTKYPHEQFAQVQSEFNEQEEKGEEEVQEFAETHERNLQTFQDGKTLKEKLKSYRIERADDYFGFGIILHTDKESNSDSHRLMYPKLEIEPKSPAFKAGLQNDQRLIAVNNKYINRDFKTINALAQEIDDSFYQRYHVEFLVLDADIWAMVQADQDLLDSLINDRKDVEMPFSNLKNEAVQVFDKSAPRVCKLTRDSKDGQYGFDFKTLKSEGRHIATNVRDEFPAHRAGLKNSDYILEVNGESIDGMEHEAVVNLIFANPKQVELLVVEDLKAYKKIQKEKEPIKELSQVIQQIIYENVPQKDEALKKCRIVLSPAYKGIGLHLNYDGIINFIEPNSPAEAAGLKKDQIIVEVNDINVRGKHNREIAKIIKENQNNLVIGVEIPSERQDQEALMAVETITQTPSSPGRIRPVDENIFLTEKSAPMRIREEEEEEPVPVYPAHEETSVPSTYSKNTGKEFKDDLIEVRTCNLISRKDYDGYGFELKKNEKGPHQIIKVEPGSPAEEAGLLQNDYILKVNDMNVVGERYSRTVAVLKNESEKGRLKLEVIEANLCPKEIKETQIVSQSVNATVTSASLNNLSVKSVSKKDKTANLKSIVKEMETADRSVSMKSIPDQIENTSTLRASRRSNKTRPLSMNDLDAIDPKQTVKSFGSTTTGFSSEAAFNTLNISGNIVSGSVRSVPNLPYTSINKPKLKKCSIQMLENEKSFGFIINPKIKPKLTIFEVERNSAAERAGIKKFDVLIEVNNKNVRRTPLDKVKNILADAKQLKRVQLLLIDKEGYLWYKEKKQRFSKIRATDDNVDVLQNLVAQTTISEVLDDGKEEAVTKNEEVYASAKPSPRTPDTSPEATRIKISRIDEYEKLNFLVVLRSDYKGFGLTLSTPSKDSNDEQLPAVKSVDRGSPADASGLRVDDQILEINGKTTQKLKSTEIGKLIKNSGNQVNFLIRRKQLKNDSNESNEMAVDAQEDGIDKQVPIRYDYDSSFNEYSDSTGQLKRASSMSSLNKAIAEATTSTSPQIVKSSITLSSSKVYGSIDILEREQLMDSAPVPRLCRVRAFEANLGFQIAGTRQTKGVFKITSVVHGSPAYFAGLKNDDYIIEVSGINVEQMSYDELITLIKTKKEEDDLQILVYDKDALEWFKENDMALSSKLVPKFTYIETLLQNEMNYSLTDSMNRKYKISHESLNALEKGEK